MKVGVFDSGIGGLNVLEDVMKNHPNIEYIYYGDTYYLPYGEKTKEELLKLGTRIIRFFEEQQVDTIIIACGTCSGLKEEFQKSTLIPIIDVITPTVEYVKENYKSVALLATQSTIQNGVFEKKLKQEGVKVYPLACPNFVPFIEGMTNQIDVRRELEPLFDKTFESIILGCTHYPLLATLIEEILHVPTIDMGHVLSEKLKLTGSNSKLTIYMSKVTPLLEQNVEMILGSKLNIIEKNLPV